MTITRISIILQPHGCDVVLVYTDLPSPYTYDGKIEHSFKFDCTYDTGSEYCKKNFPGVPITIHGETR